MLNSKFLLLLLISCLTTMVASCGGGGGGGSSTPGQVSSSQGNLSSSSQGASSVPTVPAQALSRINTPVIASSYLELLLFAKNTAATIVNTQDSNYLADGTYKDTCDGGKGSFEIKVSGNGNQLAQKYSDCLISVTENGVTETVLMSGEESISKVVNENTPSRVNITWKNYSITTNNDPALMLDGTLSYEGLLYFSSNVTYRNVTSRIKINAKFRYGNEAINIENADFTFAFPAIFDRYDSIGGWFDFEPRGLHVFTSHVVSAKGSLTVDNIKGNFNLDAFTKRVTFSNSFTERSYLDATNNGFYIKWDENNDGLIDANVFLTESEYSGLSEYLSENTNIYFTRYPKGYTTLPPNHLWEGQYTLVDLSKGASAEINVQELFTTKSGALLTYEINSQTISTDWEQLEAGRFKLLFPYSNGTEIYQLDVTAVDSNNNRSPVIKVTIRMNDNLADTDNDGILDINDPDMDNDGVANSDDRFPKDPTEWADLDGDGVGDNSDPDRDNDGITNEDDYFPNDINCSTESEGDQYGCYLSRSTYAFNDGNSIVYFLQTIRTADNSDKSRFVSFDTQTQQFLTPSPILDVSGGYVYTRVYNPLYNRVLMHDYKEKKVFLVDLNDYSLTEIRDVLGNDFYPLFSENGYFAVLVRDSETANSWTEVYDQNGQLTDSNNLESLVNPTRYLAENIQKSETVPFCDFSVSIDSNGKLIDTGDYTKMFNDNCVGLNLTSSSHHYTFPMRIAGGPRGVYDKDGSTVAIVNDEKMQWLGDKLVYLDVDSYLNNQKFDLVVNDFIADEIKRYSPVSFHIEDIYVVGEKIVSLTGGGYNAPVRFMVFDAELTVEFDSRARSGI